MFRSTKTERTTGGTIKDHKKAQTEPEIFLVVPFLILIVPFVYLPRFKPTQKISLVVPTENLRRLLERELLSEEQSTSPGRADSPPARPGDSRSRLSLAPRA